MKNLLTLFLLCSVIVLSAQDYSDVAVIMNTNDPESVLIGEYYQDRNNIPNEHMVYVEMPLEEMIDSNEAVLIIQKIKDAVELITDSDQINYFVTTKGCPQMVEAVIINSAIDHYAFESFVAFLSTEAGNNGYRNKAVPFLFSNEGYRITSRLEAGTLDGAYRLIDRGGAQVIDASRTSVLDVYIPFNVTDPNIIPLLKNQMVALDESFAAMNLPTILDTASVHFSEDRSLLSYNVLAFGQGGIPVSPFVDRTHEIAILEMIGSGLKSRYGSTLTVYDFLESKCHTALGFYDLFFISTFDNINFYENYFDLNAEMNLGESAYASMTLSTGITVFGDPKSYVTILSETQDPTTFDRDNFPLYPNPSDDFITLEFIAPADRDYHISSIDGSKVMSGESKSKEINLDVSTFPKGTYLLSIVTKDNKTTRKFIKL